ncbi:hypothetical protein AAL_02460 [Moelleriella libera RCEF 2490]|uniref:Uncharacterized protein n=1 Tax=Moelleriella libera RCEF 2490 TaxID=1081109 RepID=A0A168EKZ3_9HYPO|nr:hypothetical protein AAL_02460 [Moelleriella libera RCEF 2490]
MAPLSTQTKRRHRVFLLGLFTTLVVFSSLFTYFMLMPFSKFSAASSAASGGDGGSNVPSQQQQQQQQQHKLTGSIIRADLRALQKSSREAEFAPPPQKHQQQHRDSQHEDEFWREDVLFPPNGGYFAVISGGAQQQQQQQQQGSGDAVTGAGGGLGLAMFHQLRCLTTLRAEMQRLRDVVAVLEGSDGNGGDGLKRRRAPSSPMMHDEAHCFEYLRQSLLCSSDATIERPKLRNDGKWIIDGMGKRTCKDWDILYRASARTDRDPILPNDV